MARLLIVDDDRYLRMLYEQELTDDGYEVILAENKEDALRIYRECHPDLVVLDISMPGMDGIKTLEMLLAEDRTLPVLINTAYANFKDNFMTWAADDYVIKSGDLSNLKDAIRRGLKIKEVLFQQSGQGVISRRIGHIDSCKGAIAE